MHKEKKTISNDAGTYIGFFLTISQNYNRRTIAHDNLDKNSEVPRAIVLSHVNRAAENFL